MKVHRFIRCKNRLEAIVKSQFKGPDTDLLFCIFDESIYVYQRFQLINVSLGQFASEMNISLIDAQTIVSGAAETVEGAIAIRLNSLAALNNSVVKEVEVEELKTDAAEKIEEIFNENVEEVKEIVEEKPLSWKERFENLEREMIELKERVQKLETLPSEAAKDVSPQPEE